MKYTALRNHAPITYKVLIFILWYLHSSIPLPFAIDLHKIIFSLSLFILLPLPKIYIFKNSAVDPFSMKLSIFTIVNFFLLSPIHICVMTLVTFLLIYKNESSKVMVISCSSVFHNTLANILSHEVLLFTLFLMKESALTLYILLNSLKKTLVNT